MAVDIFLKLDGVKGESADSEHGAEIDVLNWSWGMSQSGTTHTGGGGGTGKVSVEDLFFAKYVDRSSPILQIACCNGKHFKEGLLTVRKAGETALEYLKITMKEVIISSISTGGSERITEHIKLNFGEFKLEYVPQKRDGSGDAVREIGWNIAKNVKV